LDGASFAAVFVALALLASLPVLACETLPVFDYPNHLARMHILSALPTSEFLQRYYETSWRALPNLAMDLTVPPLTGWLPLAWAGKVFVISTLCLLAGGAAILHRVLFSSWSAWPLLAFLLLYSRTFLWGLLNYLFGVGLSLFALALWIALANRPRIRLTAGTIMALSLFFAHLLAFCLYGILVMGYEAGVILQKRLSLAQSLRALVPAGATFLPAIAIYLLLTPAGASGPIAYSPIVRKLDLLFTVFDNYSAPFDIACFAIAVLAISAAFWRRWITLHPAMAIPLGLLFLIYLVMPNQIATASGADHRIPVVLGLVLLAGSRWTAPNARVARIFASAALLLFLIRMGVVAAEWRQSDRAYAELLPVLDTIPEGSRVAVATPHTIKWAHTPLYHFPAWAVVRRDAFVPILFAYPTQQPITLRPLYGELAGKLTPGRLWTALVERTAPLAPAESTALAKYDYVLIEGRKSIEMPASAVLSPLVTTPRLVLARVNPPIARR
jgi:hypothetical protein